MRLVVDLEANGLLYDADKIWCIVAYDLDEKWYYIHTLRPLSKDLIYGEGLLPQRYENVSINKMLRHLGSAEQLILHNGLGYDLPLLEKLYNVRFNIDKVFDTFTASSLFYPDRDGHSLGAWGARLGFPKGDHSDWTQYSDDMLLYCIRDVDVTRKVYDELRREMAEGIAA